VLAAGDGVNADVAVLAGGQDVLVGVLKSLGCFF
jgi:hypothetical protein